MKISQQIASVRIFERVTFLREKNVLIVWTYQTTLDYILPTCDHLLHLLNKFNVLRYGFTSPQHLGYLPHFFYKMCILYLFNTTRPLGDAQTYLLVLDWASI